VGSWCIQKTIDTIVYLADAFHSRRLKAVEDTSDLQARTVLTLQERLRLHTQVVRNWGFADVVQISSELSAPLDVPFRKSLGFGASDLIATGRHLVELLESRNSERFKRLKLVFREKTTARMVRAYYKHHPAIASAAPWLIRHFSPRFVCGLVGALVDQQSSDRLFDEGTDLLFARSGHRGQWHGVR
jgi:hypothetical protein